MTPVELLTGINLDDLVAAFGWERRPFLRSLLRHTFAGAAGGFARHMAALDEAVARAGELAKPAQKFLERHYLRSLRIEGRPPEGPALFVANHPGMADTLALFAAIARRDLKVIALPRPFLTALPNIASHMVFTDENLGRRVMAAQELANHLRAGGAALTFPAGHIEPDPALGDAASSLSTWADSARCIQRLAPDARIVPLAVSGVCWSTAHVLGRVRRAAPDREKLAAALQVIAMVAAGLRPTEARVRFGDPIAPGPTVHTQVMASMRRLLSAARPVSNGPAAGEQAAGPSFALGLHRPASGP